MPVSMLQPGKVMKIGSFDRARAVPRGVSAFATEMRRDVINMVTKAGSGHVGGSLSCADMMAVLFSGHMKIDPMDPKNPMRDRFVLSKGHAAPILYSALARRGYFGMSELDTLRVFGSILQGHPDMLKTPGVDFSTGMLGLGFAAAVGMAVASIMSGRNFNVYTMLGDGESDEGIVREAAALAGYWGLGNFTAFLDFNRLKLGGSLASKEDLGIAFANMGWAVADIDGHDFNAIAQALELAKLQTEAPTLILARTVKGKGVPFMENNPDWHGKAPTPEQAQEALAALDVFRDARLAEQLIGELGTIQLPPDHLAQQTIRALNMDYDRWNKAQATRVTYGEWLDLAMEQNPWILALQADVDKSVRTDIAAKHHGYFNGKTGRVFDVGIRENGMFGISAGLPTCGFYPSLSTFAMFGPMGLGIFNQITATHLPYMVVNSHGGLQVEQDGKTHMDLLSPAQFGANPRIRVIEPGDSRSAAQLLTNAFNNRDAQPFTFVRTSRSSITAQEDLGDIDTRCYRVKVLNPTKETGRTITIVASGAMMGVAREVADLINNSAQHSGKVIRIVDAFAPKEFGKISVKDEDALGNPSVVVTLIDADPEILEDSVTKYLHRRKMTGEVLALGALPDDAQSGTAKAIYDAAGLSPQKIFDRIAEFINQAI